MYRIFGNDKKLPRNLFTNSVSLPENSFHSVHFIFYGNESVTDTCQFFGFIKLNYYKKVLIKKFRLEIKKTNKYNFF